MSIPNPQRVAVARYILRADTLFRKAARTKDKDDRNALIGAAHIVQRAARAEMRIGWLKA